MNENDERKLVSVLPHSIPYKLYYILNRLNSRNNKQCFFPNLTSKNNFTTSHNTYFFSPSQHKSPTLFQNFIQTLSVRTFLYVALTQLIMWFTNKLLMKCKCTPSFQLFVEVAGEKAKINCQRSMCVWSECFC